MFVTSASKSIFPSAINRIFAKVADFCCECDHSFNWVGEQKASRFEKGETYKLNAMSNSASELLIFIMFLLTIYIHIYFLVKQNYFYPMHSLVEKASLKLKFLLEINLNALI